MRIVAAADVFGALKEDRPYHEGIEQNQIMKTRNQMTVEGVIDGDCVPVIVKLYDDIEANWVEVLGKGISKAPENRRIRIRR